MDGRLHARTPQAAQHRLGTAIYVGGIERREPGISVPEVVGHDERDRRRVAVVWTPGVEVRPGGRADGVVWYERGWRGRDAKSRGAEHRERVRCAKLPNAASAAARAGAMSPLTQDLDNS